MQYTKCSIITAAHTILHSSNLHYARHRSNSVNQPYSWLKLPVPLHCCRFQDCCISTGPRNTQGQSQEARVPAVDAAAVQYSQVKAQHGVRLKPHSSHPSLCSRVTSYSQPHMGEQHDAQDLMSCLTVEQQHGCLTNTRCAAMVHTPTPPTTHYTTTHPLCHVITRLIVAQLCTRTSRPLTHTYIDVKVILKQASAGIRMLVPIHSPTHQPSQSMPSQSISQRKQASAGSRVRNSLCAACTPTWTDLTVQQTGRHASLTVQLTGKHVMQQQQQLLYAPQITAQQPPAQPTFHSHSPTTRHPSPARSMNCGNHTLSLHLTNYSMLCRENLTHGNRRVVDMVYVLLGQHCMATRCRIPQAHLP